MESIGFRELFYLMLVLCGLVIAFLAAVVFITIKVLDRRLRRCPECDRTGTGFIADTETFESNSHIDYRQNNPMRTKEFRRVDHYECEHCGHQWTRTSERVDRTPYQPPSESV